MDKRQTNAPGAISSGDITSDELTQARAKRAEVAAKLEQEQDEENRIYFRKVIAEWDKYIARLEAKHATREAAVQAEHRSGELSPRGD